MKIGLFGGSFNPIQNRHISIIKQLLNKKIIDRVRIITCKKHAFNKSLLSEKHRIKMIKLAIKGIKNVKICDIELKSKTKNYTLKTIKKLKSKYGHEFFLIIGSDILHEIEKWYKYKELLKEIEFIVIKRKNYKIKKIPRLKIESLIKTNVSSISATEIRKRIKKGKSLKNLVPDYIIKYIKKKSLYK
jgi:nicotinate-nucleotide adenylyltransferase